MDGWTLPALTGSRIVFQRHGNPLLTREIETRFADTEAFLLTAASNKVRVGIIERYGVTHVLLNLREPSTFAANLPEQLGELGSKVAEENGLALYRVQQSHKL